MIRYGELSPWIHGCLMLWAAGVVLVAAYLLAGALYRGHRKIYQVNAIIVMASVYLFTQYMSGVQMLVHPGVADASAPFLGWFAMLPASLVLCVMILLTIYEFLVAWQEAHWQRHHLSNRSIKEATDMVPIGLCYYWDNGTVKLVNPSMNELSQAMCGEIVRDGNAFHRMIDSRLSRGSVKAIQIDGTDPVYEMPGGIVVRFHFSRLQMHGSSINEISALQVTNEYELWLTLKSDTARLAAVNRRMETLGKQIDQMIAEKEVLDAKVRIHDSMGRTMLATRKYLESGDPKDSERLDEYWGRVLLLLNADVKTGEGRSPKADLVEAGKVLGLQITFAGQFPDGQYGRALEFLMSGARECMTNACRHAGADELQISSTQENGVWIIEYTNNGRTPVEAIAEGGGLSTLRTRIEADGGRMEVEWQPRFLLRIVVIEQQSQGE